MAALASVPAASTAAPSTPAATSTAVTNIQISTATTTQPVLWNVCFKALSSAFESNDFDRWMYVYALISIELSKIFPYQIPPKEPTHDDTYRAVIFILVQPDYEAVVRRLIQDKLPTLAASSISVHTTTRNNRRFEILMTGTPPAINNPTCVAARQLDNRLLTDTVRDIKLRLVSHLQPQPPSAASAATKTSNPLPNAEHAGSRSGGESIRILHLENKKALLDLIRRTPPIVPKDENELLDLIRRPPSTLSNPNRTAPEPRRTAPAATKTSNN